MAHRPLEALEQQFKTKPASLAIQMLKQITSRKLRHWISLNGKFATTTLPSGPKPNESRSCAKSIAIR